MPDKYKNIRDQEEIILAEICTKLDIKHRRIERTIIIIGCALVLLLIYFAFFHKF